jgi:hypothetical protein
VSALFLRLSKCTAAPKKQALAGVETARLKFDWVGAAAFSLSRDLVPIICVR